MTADEARKLIGGYTARTLTDDERAALFEAALNDQELFEELIHEQAIQEVMDDPGSRAALLAVLDASEPKRPWWNVWWVPAGAIAVAACLTVGVLWTWGNRLSYEMVPVARNADAYIRSAPAPAPAEKTIILPQARKKALVAPSVSPAPPPPPASLSREAEVQARSSVAIATPMAAPAVQDSKALRALAQHALTLVRPNGVIHPGDDVSVMAMAEIAGFLYVYEREDAGPWTLMGGPQGLDMTPGRMRPLPQIRIPDGTARVTILAFLTPEQESPPSPDQITPGRLHTELVLDVIHN